MENSINRKKFLRISAFSAIAVGGGALVGKTIYDALTMAKEYSEARNMMGTKVEIKLGGASDSVAQNDSARVFTEVARLSEIFSRFDPQAQVAKLNAQGFLSEACSELLEVLRLAKQYGNLTGGAFDVSILPMVNLMETHFAGQRQLKSQNSAYTIVPPSAEEFAQVASLVDYRNIVIEDKSVRFAQAGMQISLDGIAKGYIVGKAVDILTSLGYVDVLVNGGGDIATSGKNPKGESWKIGISHPRALAGYYAIAAIDGGALATSGDYEVPNSYTSDNTFHHIINPKTASWSDLASATVWAPNSALADVLATACMALGSYEGVKLIEKVEGAECLLIKKDLSFVQSSAFPTSKII